MRSIICLMVCSNLAVFAAEPGVGSAQSHELYEEKIGNSGVRFTMVPIRGGTFQLGSPKDELGRLPDEGPQRSVTIAPFWMGKCEVTWNEFRLYFRDRPMGEQKALRSSRDRDADAVSKPTAPYIDETYGFGVEGYPAINMSHHAAMVYCEWLSKKTGHTYRLPTEAEWEYACRAGSTTAFSFGDKINEKTKRYLWYRENSATDVEPTGQPHPVGRTTPNAWGLYDMHGNVAEWCLDHYDSKQYDLFPWDKRVLNPVKLPTDKRYSHVTRGGNFASSADDCRSAARWASTPKWNRLDPGEPQSIWWLAPGDAKICVGFRVVRSLEETTPLKGIRSKVTTASR